MADPFSVNIGLALPLRGSDVGVWDVPVNADFNAFDGYLGGVQTVSASSAPILLTSPAGFTPTPGGGPTQSQNAVIRFTGALSSGVQVTLPLPGFIIVENLTTGAFVLSFRAIGSGEVVGVEQGVIQHLYNDGTNVRFVNLPTVGSYMDICDATVPAWITACTKPPWLNCDGTTFSAVTYPYLNTKLGGTTLPDSRGRSRSALNQGTSRVTSAGSGIDGNTRFSAGGDQLLVTHSHANTLTDPTHFHQVPSGAGSTVVQAGSSQGTIAVASPQNTAGASTGIIINNANAGAGASQNMPPTYISGLTLIRAA